MKLRVNTVFVPGGMPQHTYVPRTERDLEAKLRSAKDNLCKLATLTGSTKSGKTVLANRIFSRSTGENIWVDGGTIKNEDDLWQQVLASLDGHTSMEQGIVSEKSDSLGASGSISSSIFGLAKGKAKVETSTTQKKAESEKRSLTLSARPAAIAQLRDSRLPLIIDDFHYIDRDFQGDIIRALKPLIFEGHCVLIIAIPHRRYDAVKVEREMTGRVESIQVPAWNDSELREISGTGFPLLNLVVRNEIVDRLVSEAYGSPHLMQEFCRGVCQSEGMSETVEVRRFVNGLHSSLFRGIAEGTGKVIFDKLAKGPRQRSDRKARPLQSGGSTDIYRLVLLALANLTPGMEKVEYEVLRTSIKGLLKSDVPQSREVSRVLEKMADIAASDESSTPVIDWDKSEQQLHVTDPFFAFFLKWGVNIQLDATLVVE